VGIDGLVVVTLPLPVLAALIGPWFLLAVYPSEFLASASALTILCVALVLIIHNAWQGFSLLAAGFQRVTLAYLVGLLINIVLNVALIGRFGYMGAAWAALGTSIFITVCSGVAAAKLLEGSFASLRLAGAVAANVALAATLWLLLWLGLPWPVATALALGSYPGWLALFRVAQLADLRRILPTPPIAWAGARGTAGL
jgi:O-antigen/teichoic acid export membrane protein